MVDSSRHFDGRIDGRLDTTLVELRMVAAGVETVWKVDFVVRPAGGDVGPSALAIIVVPILVPAEGEQPV